MLSEITQFSAVALIPLAIKCSARVSPAEGPLLPGSQCAPSGAEPPKGAHGLAVFIPQVQAVLLLVHKPRERHRPLALGSPALRVTCVLWRLPDVKKERRWSCADCARLPEHGPDAPLEVRLSWSLGS